MKYSLGDHRVECRGNVFLAPNSTVIGRVVLEHDVGVWFNAVIRGDNDLITVGTRSNIQEGCVLHTDEGYQLSVGRDVTVGHMVMLHGCTIGDGSLIGIKSVVMNGARVGRHCIIGANTLITEGKEIPDRSLVVGSPGKIVRQITDEEVEFLLWSAESYVQKVYRYQREFRPQQA
ncbi:MAG: gamma carbonic anhydrase family protein [Betaproteobacteria bacterium]|nr:gamma carbonic anhydrase family protein [Betaproteobacteria bacterium]